MNNFIPEKPRFSMCGFGPVGKWRGMGKKIIVREGFFGDGERVVLEHVQSEAEWREFW